MSSTSSSSSPASSSSAASSSTSMSSSSSSIHPASLVDAALHSPHTLRLVSIKITKQLIDHVVDQVIDTVDYAMGKASPSTPRGRHPRNALQIKFTSFASTVLARAEITTPTLLATLIYIARARPFLHIALEEWALERVFLGALITASKYLNDSTLKNVHWALCTGVFGKRDVGRIEREFLAVLDWELGITEGEVLGLWEGLEWAVEEEEREERRLRERAERHKQRERAEAAMRAAEQQQQQKRMFYFSSEPKTHSRSSSIESDSMPAPPVPPKPSRNHHRRTHPAPIIPSLPHLTHSSSSPTSSSASSSSSSSSSNTSSPRTPLTPGDYDLAYPEPEELSATSASSSAASSQPQLQRPPLVHGSQYAIPPVQVHQHQYPYPQVYVPEEAGAAMDVDELQVVPPAPQQKRSVKRSFGATTMEILKSFPFPGHHSHSHSHHHHHHHQHAQQRSSS